MIYFNSDYLEGAHSAIMERLMETNMMQTIGYSEDEICASAREKIKAACHAPDADVHFLVGGTQTNTTVIASILRPWQGVLSAVTTSTAMKPAPLNPPATRSSPSPLITARSRPSRSPTM